MKSVLRAVFATAVLHTSSGPPGAQTPASDDEAAVAAFEARVAAYVELHRRLEGPLPTLGISDDLDKVHAAMAALARQVRDARPNARQGDVFSPDVSRVFRARIGQCLCPDDLQEIRAEQDEHLPRRVPPLRVNGTWPHDAPFSYVPPQLLAALPPLPVELQYRIIGRALVLWDHHADLIVDFIPGAFAG
jgi:hypothetical protein